MATMLGWHKSDGSQVAGDGSLANGATYYAELPVGGATMFSVSATWDASVIVTLTLEACNKDDATPYAPVGASGWSTRATLGSIVVAGGSAGTDAFDIVGAPCSRYRMKAVVGGTGGVATPRFQAKS